MPWDFASQNTNMDQVPCKHRANLPKFLRLLRVYKLCVNSSYSNIICMTKFVKYRPMSDQVNLQTYGTALSLLALRQSTAAKHERKNAPWAKYKQHWKWLSDPSFTIENSWKYRYIFVEVWIVSATSCYQHFLRSNIMTLHRKTSGHWPFLSGGRRPVLCIYLLTVRGINLDFPLL